MNETAIAYASGGITCALVVVATPLALRTDRRLRARAALLMAWAYMSQLIASVLMRVPTTASIDAIIIAICLWYWWNNGGGDGMRRLWKKLKARMTVSSPAPQSA